jgi:hypothetical protein
MSSTPSLRPPRRRRWRWLAAAAASCLVYLVPLVGPHAVWTVGETLSAWLRHRSTRDPAWLMADLAIVSGLQLLTLIVVWWSLGRGWIWRAVAWLGTACVVTWSANVLLSLVIPQMFLIEAETAPAQVTWSRVCGIRDVSLMALPFGAQRALWPAGLALVSDPTGTLRILDARTCRTRDLGLSTQSAAVQSISRDGTLMYQTLTRGAPVGPQHLRFADGRTIALTEPAGRRDVDGAAVLSDDAGWVGWLIPVPGSGQPPHLEAVIRSVRDGTERRVTLEALRPGSLVLTDIDGTRQTLAVSVDREAAVVAFDGSIVRRVRAEDGIAPLPGTIRTRDDGSLWWDGYVDEAPYRVGWRLGAATGAHRIAKGRSITDIAVDGAGQWVALSATSQYSIGNTPDSVYVIRAADGREAFRQYFPKYTRATLAFPAPDLFAYAGLDGVEVFRLPHQ